MVACLLNQISVLSEESSKRNAYISNRIATDSNRKVMTRSAFQYSCISMNEKNPNVILVKEKLIKRRTRPWNECIILALV